MKTPIRLLIVAIAVLLAPFARALSIYALTSESPSRLLLVDADVPADVLSVRTITGLDAGDSLVGIDVRPATGQLYGLGAAAHLYTIDPNTGIATKVADLAADPTDVTPPSYTGLTGTNYGIDFNPLVDRLRVVNDADQNLRINPANGLVMADISLSYAPAPDRNAGANPNVGDIAYSNNFAGATATTLFGIDDTTLDLVRQEPPNNGTLVSPADPAPHFGDVLATHAGFDIAPDGTAYIVGVHPGPDFVLVGGDLTTGALDSHGQIGDGTIPIRDIAVAPTISFSAEKYAVFENAGNATITVRREGFVNVPASVEFTTHSDTASAASDYQTTSGVLNFPTKTVTTSADTVDALTFQVPIVNDILPEDDEFVDLFLTRITSGQGVVGFPSSASLRIDANDTTDEVGPQVVSIGLTGPSRAIDGAVVHFNEDMDPATATNVANYKLTVFPRGGAPQVKAFSTAVYDPVARMVTLGLAPFMQTDNKRMALQVNGKGATGVKDVNGNLLDGDRNRRPGGNAVQVFKIFSGTTVRYTDRDGDRAEINIAQGGHIDGVRPLGGPTTQLTQFWIVDPIALRSTLSGTVQKAPRGDGIVVIAEIIGLDKKEFTPLLSNSSFRVNTLTFSSNATGIGALVRACCEIAYRRPEIPKIVGKRCYLYDRFISEFKSGCELMTFATGSS